MNSPSNRHEAFLDALAPIVDGEPETVEQFADLLVESDACRDLRHEATQVARDIAEGGADYLEPANLEAQVLAAIDARTPAGFPATQVSPVAAATPVQRTVEMPNTPPVGSPMPTTRSNPPHSIGGSSSSVATQSSPDKRSGARVIALFAALGGIGAMAAAAVVGLVYFGSTEGPTAASEAALSARVVTIVRAAEEGQAGVTVRRPGNEHFEPITENVDLVPGTMIRTDGRTRAEVRLSDGSVLIVNRNTELELTADAPRTIDLRTGELVADVAHLESGPHAIYRTPGGRVEVLGTKFVLTATEDFANVRVTRGVVRVRGHQEGGVLVHAGQEGSIVRNQVPTVATATQLGSSMDWAELDEELEDDVPIPGIGELRASRPGERNPEERPLRLEHHKVTVRIVGNVARTEIEETFQNDGPHTLEGIYRFPLPPDARIASLQLEVDGQWEQGAFVERNRAQKIWRGVIRNATPRTQRQQQEEFIWVPGPWRDPALLEWQRGGRFELRIFPIPAHGARRIRLAYEQTIAPLGTGRRYTYPLAHSHDDSTRVGRFEVDARIQGLADQTAVRVHGYEAQVESNGTSQEIRFVQDDFYPNGNLIIDYRSPDDAAELRWWTFRGEATVAPADHSREDNPEAIDAQRALHEDHRGYVAFALRPELPAWTEAETRDYVMVVDASQSMFGERYERAIQLVNGVISEMDRRDRFRIMVCDATCRSMSDDARIPSAHAANEVDTWLRTIRPAGASDFVNAIREAAQEGGMPEGRKVHLLYFGDGLASVGHRRTSSIMNEVARITADESIRVTTIGIGDDADTAVLAAAARAGGGHYVPYVPGRRTTAAALSVLETTYGASLEDAVIEFPAGVEAVAPQMLPTLRAGEEFLVVARLTQDEIRGELKLTGTIAGERFEDRYPVTLTTSQARGNAFVPRLWAAKTIEDLELKGRGEDAARIIALSKAYGVMSRETSLLVLESEAMFRAFGVDRQQPNLQWSGEDDMEMGESEGLAQFSSDGYAMGVGTASGDRGRGGPSTRSRPSAPMVDAFGPSGALDSREARSEAAPATAQPMPSRDARRPGQWMRREWYREAQVVSPGGPTERDRRMVQQAEDALRENPDSRDRHRDLVLALMRAAELGRAQELAEKWVERDRLDAEALTVLADILARQGRRDDAIRILSGVVDLQSDNRTLQERLADAFERAGEPSRACGHRIALAEIDASNVETAARAVRCERSLGHEEGATQILTAAADQQARERIERESRSPAGTPDRLRGNLLVEATWSGPNDVDITIITSTGQRISWMGGHQSMFGRDSAHAGREQLGLRWLPVGRYQIEVSRTDPDDTRPIQGELRITALESRRTIPFALIAQRAEVAQVTIARRSRLVPVRGGGDFGL